MDPSSRNPEWNGLGSTSASSAQLATILHDRLVKRHWRDAVLASKATLPSSVTLSSPSWEVFHAQSLSLVHHGKSSMAILLAGCSVLECLPQRKGKQPGLCSSRAVDNSHISGLTLFSETNDALGRGRTSIIKVATSILFKAWAVTMVLLWLTQARWLPLAEKLTHGSGRQHYCHKL